MSTIKAANIQNPSAASAAIVLDTSGNFSVPAGTVSAPGIQAPSDSNTGIFFPAADTIAFAEGGTEAMRIDSSSRLLVGTSTALTNVQHYGSNYTPVFQVQGTNQTNSFASITRTDGYSPHLFFNTGSSGNNPPSGRNLGTVVFNGFDGTNYVNAAAIEGVVDGTPGANDMPGRLVFSTTADGASSPTERMRIANDGAFDHYTDERFHVRTKRTSANTGAFAVYSSATSTSTGNEVFLVQVDGDCQNVNGSYGAISDIKIKENIVNANSQWNDVKNLQVRNYNLKVETGFNTHTQIGLIAQEVELVSPGLVGESINEKTGESIKSIKYSVLYMKAVKALQEAIERIEQLEAEMAEIKAQLS